MWQGDVLGGMLGKIITVEDFRYQTAITESLSSRDVFA